MALSRVFHRTAKVSHFGYQTTHGMKLARLLTALTCTSAIVFAHEPQEPAQWGADVVRACTSQRFGLRLAASKKVAQAGDAAVPAVREFAATHGKDALPAAMVEAIVDLGGNGEAVLALLTDWASDRDFYWRAQAMKGLAVRSKEPLLGARFRQLFAAHEQDAAWLMRVYAQLGFALAEKSATAAEATPGDVVRAKELDPRASTKLAALRSQHGLPFAPAHLMDALGDERTFLGDPWGRRRAQEACTALQNWLGADGGYRSDASFAENRAAIDQLLKLARCKTNLALLAPVDQRSRGHVHWRHRTAVLPQRRSIHPLDERWNHFCRTRCRDQHRAVAVRLADPVANRSITAGRATVGCGHLRQAAASTMQRCSARSYRPCGAGADSRRLAKAGGRKDRRSRESRACIGSDRSSAAVCFALDQEDQYPDVRHHRCPAKKEPADSAATEDSRHRCDRGNLRPRSGHECHADRGGSRRAHRT